MEAVSLKFLKDKTPICLYFGYLTYKLSGVPDNMHFFYREQQLKLVGVVGFSEYVHHVLWTFGGFVLSWRAS